MARHKRKRKRASSERKRGWRDRFTEFIIVCTFAALFGVPLIFKQRDMLPQCTAGGVAGVVMNNQVDGTLVRGSRKEFFVRSPGGHERALTTCTRNSCKGPYTILERQTTGRPAHAEFCGIYLTLIAIDNVAVHMASPPTQAALDLEARQARTFGWVCLLFVVTVALVTAWRSGKTSP
jgi:hypothetical protein